jgi:ATP-dependent DNA helicase RecQ
VRFPRAIRRPSRTGWPAGRTILLSSRADLGRLINFITRDQVEPQQVLGLVRRLHGQTVIDAPSRDRDRVALGIAERAGLVHLEPAAGGRLAVSLKGAPDNAYGKVQVICRQARDRAWLAYHTVEAFASNSDTCRRQILLTHFADERPPAPGGRCCDVCDPKTIGLPDPNTLTRAKTRQKRRTEPETTLSAEDASSLRSCGPGGSKRRTVSPPP